jgi:hypothetical protein
MCKRKNTREKNEKAGEGKRNHKSNENQASKCEQFVLTNKQA